MVGFRVDPKFNCAKGLRKIYFRRPDPEPDLNYKKYIEFGEETHLGDHRNIIPGADSIFISMKYLDNKLLDLYRRTALQTVKLLKTKNVGSLSALTTVIENGILNCVEFNQVKQRMRIHGMVTMFDVGFVYAFVMKNGRQVSDPDTVTDFDLDYLQMEFEEKEWFCKFESEAAKILFLLTFKSSEDTLFEGIF